MYLFIYLFYTLITNDFYLFSYLLLFTLNYLVN